jgi:excisionase family DNA binding protein
MDDRWLSVGEIAEYLGISKDTVYAWITNKGLPGHRIGRFWKFKRLEVDEWVHRGKAGDAETAESDD